MRCPRCKSEAVTKFGPHHDGRQRYKCKDCGFRTLHPELTPYREEVEIRKDLTEKRTYIFTSAQNATPVHNPFFKSLLNYSQFLDAELGIIPIRYKNPTSIWSEKMASQEWWYDQVIPYLFEGRQIIHPHFLVMGDVKTQLTAVNPLTGFESITGHRSAVFGHPKRELKCIATPHHKLPKIISTTGACTVENYTDSRAGKRGEFHHSLGATIVEIDGDVFHTRQIAALKNGTFQDLRYKVTPEGVTDGPRAAGLVMGDTHVDFVDPAVVNATFTGPSSIVSIMEPRYLIWHDLLDAYSINPYTTGDPFAAVAKYEGKMNHIREEIDRAAAFLDVHAPKDCENVIVPSNHNDFLSRWMDRTDWRSDPANAKFYLETALAMVEHSKMTEKGVDRLDPFPYWLKRLSKHSNVRCVPWDGSFTIRGIEVGMHGHLGPNGARGSLLNLSKIGVKSVVGHSHTPGITEGCTQVGTSSRLRLDYNIGPSSWLNTHCIIYENGKRSLINVINGSWRLAA